MSVEPRVIIFSTVWPEPNSSAAGVRQMHWISLFRSMGYLVTLISPSKLKSDQDWGAVHYPDGVSVLPLPLNRESGSEELVRLNPEIVLFDRFILEEQFGHLVYRACPNALVLLETQDLHFVRRARQLHKATLLEQGELDPLQYQTETAIRETGSILRVDSSVVVSSFEERLLKEQFGIENHKVKWVPFFYDPAVMDSSLRPEFNEKIGFCWIGNFRHDPNLDGLRWFRNEIWPLIRKKLPSATINVFGAYPPEEVMSWHQPKQGFCVHGSAQSLDEVFVSARVNLAPLRYGAGVKGKIMEGFRYGVPCVTTRYGEEGLFEVFPGRVANDSEAFAEACIDLHEIESDWIVQSNRAIETMNFFCCAQKRMPELHAMIREWLDHKRSGIFPDWISKVLRYEGNQSRYYFAKWIEAKEKG